jgi:hypothetical protein
MRPGRWAASLWVALLAVSLLLTASVFLGARTLLPGDGARIDFSSLPSGASGLLVGPLSAETSALLPGDQLLSIQGRSIEDWLRSSLSVQSFQFGTPSAHELEFSLLRDGRVDKVTVPLRQHPLGPVLRENWTSYVFFLYLLAVGLVVFILRPEMPSARLFLILSCTITGSGTIFFTGLQPSDLLRGWLVWLWIFGTVILYGVLSANLVHFALTFPRVRPVLVRHRWMLPGIYIGPWLFYVGYLLLSWSHAGTPTARLLLIERGAGLMTASYFPLALLVAFQGYRSVFTEEERHQVRWVLWGASIAIIPWLVLSVLPELFNLPFELDPRLPGLLWWALPATFAVAILRNRLFDIDIIINRTLVYGSLTGILAGIYFGSTVALQSLFRTFTGQDSPMAIVVSTLVIAALSSPLRVRIQSTIDRRFYRAKYDAKRALTTLAAAARDEVDIERLADSLLSAVEETLQPAATTLWLKNETGKP